MITKKERITQDNRVGWRTYPVPNFVVGDAVAYSVQFLRSIGAVHGEMAAGRGVITALEPVGTLTLARITWRCGELPERVNVFNLAKVGPNPRFVNCD